MDLMHMDEQNSFRNMVIATVCGYGTDEKKATLHVQLPYMKKGEDILEDVELLLPYGGKDYGFLCRPEIGDQVMVLFSGEHMRRAVAIGCIAPGDASIWEVCSEKNEQKQWLMKNGMKLSLWDEEEAAKAEITCQDIAMQLDEKEQQLQLQLKDSSLLLDGKNGCVKLDAEKEIKLVCGEGSITMKKDGTICIEGKKLQIKGQALTSETTMDTKISAQKVNLEAKLEVGIKGNSSVKISASGITEVQGGIVKLG